MRSRATYIPFRIILHPEDNKDEPLALKAKESWDHILQVTGNRLRNIRSVLMTHQDFPL